MVTESFFMQEVTVLKTVIQEKSRIREYSSEEIRQLIEEISEERIAWAKNNDAIYGWRVGRGFGYSGKNHYGFGCDRGHD